LFQKASLAFCVRVKDILDLFFSLDIFLPFFKAKSQKTFGLNAPEGGLESTSSEPSFGGDARLIGSSKRP